MELRDFRNQLHRHIDQHGEPYGHMFTPAENSIGTGVEIRVFTEYEGLREGNFLKGPDGIEKLIFNITAGYGIALVTLVSIPQEQEEPEEEISIPEEVPQAKRGLKRFIS